MIDPKYLCRGSLFYVLRLISVIETVTQPDLMPGCFQILVNTKQYYDEIQH